jgi:hypothetical protein
MAVDLLTHIILYQPGHDDDGLPHKIHEQTFDDNIDGDDKSKIEKTSVEFIIGYIRISLGRLFKQLNLTMYQVQGFPYLLRYQYAKVIGTCDKYNAQNKVPLILYKISVKCK